MQAASMTNALASSGDERVIQDARKRVRATAREGAMPIGSSLNNAMTSIASHPADATLRPTEIHEMRRRFIECGALKRHLDKSTLRKTATGPWAKAYARIEKRLGLGQLTALLGTRGSGKTQMAVCLIAEASQRGIRGLRYLKASELFREIRNSYRPDGPSEIQTIHRLTSGGLLVIDELHERADSAFERRALVDVIDTRYAKMLDTILISNETPAGFAESVGPSIVSRVHEAGEAIECTWESFRKAGVE